MQYVGFIGILIKQIYKNLKIFQALWRNAIKLKVATVQNAKEHIAKHFVILQMMALALLPVHEIGSAFENIRARTKKVYKNYFDEYFNYFQSYWLERRGAKTFCVYQIGNRSNNASESYHRTLNEKMSHVRPTVWRFLGKILV